MRTPYRPSVLHPSTALPSATVGAVAVVLALALLAPAVAAGADLESRLEVVRERFPALAEGDPAAAPDLAIMRTLPADVSGPAGLAVPRQGATLSPAAEAAPDLRAVSWVSATVNRGAGRAAARLGVSRRVVAGPAPQEAVVLALPADAGRSEVVQLALDPRASGVEVWEVDGEGGVGRLLGSDRPFGGQSLYLEAEPGGLYVVTLSYPWE